MPAETVFRGPAARARTLHRRFRALAALALVLSACAVIRSPPTVRVALLAPFEGRYREVGYNALYAARLALKDNRWQESELLPVDDGGSPVSAAERARALALDPLMRGVIVVGYDAAAPEVQIAFADVPILIVGDWNAPPAGDNAFVLASPALAAYVTSPPGINVINAAALPAPVTGGEVFALEQFARLRDSLDNVRVVSSGTLPDSDFAARYASDALFAPQPGLLATLVYDATSLAVQAALLHQHAPDPRAAAADSIRALAYTGLNGEIAFDATGYWRNAPVNFYRFDEAGRLIAVPNEHAD